MSNAKVGKDSGSTGAQFPWSLISRPLVNAFGVLIVVLVLMILVVGILVIIAIVEGTTVTIAGLEFGIKKGQQEGLVNVPSTPLQWEQRRYTAELSLREYPELTASVSTIYKCFIDWSTTGTESSVITIDDANKIINSKDQALFSAIKTHLNHLEGLSMAYLYGAVDKDAFEGSYKVGIQRWYRRYEAALAPFESKCGCTWKPFQKLGSAWAIKVPPSSGQYGDSCRTLLGKS